MGYIWTKLFVEKQKREPSIRWTVPFFIDSSAKDYLVVVLLALAQDYACRKLLGGKGSVGIGDLHVVGTHAALAYVGAGVALALAKAGLDKQSENVDAAIGQLVSANTQETNQAGYGILSFLFSCQSAHGHDFWQEVVHHLQVW